MSIAKRVLECRKACGLTQEQLAVKAGIGSQTVSRIECGDEAVQLATLQKIAAVLGVTLASLVMDEAAANPSPERAAS